MTCPTETELTAWAENPSANNELASHVAECARCQAALKGTACTAELPLGGPQASPAAPVAPTVLPPGTLVGRFVVTGELGAGGMGQVYSATDPELGRAVALKLLTAQASEDTTATEARSRLRREAQALARLSHPNVVSIYEVGTHEGQVFLAMELIGGLTLRAWLKERPRSWSEVVPVFMGAGAGLGAAHEAGLVHRDFKPQNVLIGTDGRVRVLDFGIARTTDAEHRPTAATNETSDSSSSSASVDLLETPLTQVGHISGTAGYIAPELLRQERVDARADQFAFGVALYEALWGQRPFASRTVLEYLQALTSGPRGEVPKDRPVPRWLRSIVLRCIALHPEDRFASMKEVLAALGRGQAATRRLPWLIGGAIAAVVLAGAVSLQLVRSARQCAHQERNLVGIWDEPIRAQVEAAFRALNRPWANRAGGEVRARLDAKAADWVTLAGQTCQALKRDEATAVRERTMMRDACLRRQLAEFAALTGALTRVDLALAQRAADFAEDFDLSSDCHSEQHLGRLTAEHVTPPLVPLAIQLRTRILNSRVADWSGRDDEAMELATSVLADGQRAGLLGFVSEAHYRLGAMHQQRGEYSAAEAEFSAALAAAEEARNDEMILSTASSLATTLADDLERLDEGKRVYKTAEAAFARLGRDPRYELELLDVRASLATLADEPEVALQVRQQALAVATKLMGPSHPWTASAASTLGDAHVALGQLDEAVLFHRRALTSIIAARGEGHPDVPDFMSDLGLALVAAGDLKEGLPLLQRAAEEDPEPDSLQGANYHANWANELCVIDPVRATQIVARSLAAYEATNDAPGLADILLTTGRVHRFSGRPAAALADCQKARAVFEPRTNQPSRVRFVASLVCIGHAQLDLGDARGAVKTLELASAKMTEREPRVLADLAFTLARALVADHQDGARARSLASAALQRLRPFPSLEAERSDIEAWLASPTSKPRRFR